MFLGIVIYNTSVIAHWTPCAPHQHWWCLCWELCSHGIIMREMLRVSLLLSAKPLPALPDFLLDLFGLPMTEEHFILWSRTVLMSIFSVNCLTSNQPTLLCLKLYLENRDNSSYKVAVKILMYLWEIPLKLWVPIDHYSYPRDYYEVDYTWMYNFKWLKKKK